MKKYLNILYLFFIVIIIQYTSFAQNKSINKQNKKKIMVSKLYGFKLEYQGKLTKKSKNEYTIVINNTNPRVLICIKVDSKPSVYLPGTYGGWFYLTNKNSIQMQSNIVATKQDTINGIFFTKEYWLVYGGEGSWDTIINSYTRYKNRFYILSFVHEFLRGVPEMIINNKKNTKQELLDKGLKAMKDKENVYVKSFNEILSSFSFSK